VIHEWMNMKHQWNDRGENWSTERKTCPRINFYKIILLWYIILNLTCVLLSATTNFISPVSTCYMFRSYWPSSGFKCMILELKIKFTYTVFQILRSHKLYKPVSLCQPQIPCPLFWDWTRALCWEASDWLHKPWQDHCLEEDEKVLCTPCHLV
jgi:hypothetical protein